MKIGKQEGTGDRRHQAGCLTSPSPQSGAISVIIPAKNEAKSIGALLYEIEEGLSGCSHEVIVVDDGSKDETAEIANGIGSILVSHKTNLGKGAAMKSGAQKATGEIIVFLDGDGAHNPKDIPVVIAPILERKADFVIGSRALRESEVPAAPLLRKLSNNLASLIISAIISFALPLVTFKYPRRIKITDCTSGFRAVRREAWQKLELISNGFEIETEMIYEAAKSRLRITEAPISCNWNSQLSHLSILGDGLKTMKLLTRKLLFTSLDGKLRIPSHEYKHYHSDV